MSFSIEAFIQILVFSLLPSPAFCSISLNTLTPNLPIRDGDVLVSSNKTYALGFFSPGKSRYRYVGVWFNNVPKQTIVWVANRDNQINDFSGGLSINGDGGLVIRGKDRISKPVWSANVTLASPNSSIAKLLDTGNLVLLESESSQRVVWQGFDQPSDTFLPSMKVGLNRQSGLDRFLTSWKSKDDPGTGSCKYGLDLKGLPQLFLYKDGGSLWRGGPWIGNRWSGVASLGAAVGRLYKSNLIVVNNEDEISYMYVVDSNVTTRGMIDESGTYRRLIWKYEEWIELISYPNE